MKNKRTVMFVLALGLLLSACVGPAQGVVDVNGQIFIDGEPLDEALVYIDELEQLQEDFNQAAGLPRIILLLSPT